MRLAVFSDIHGNYTAFEAALADFETVGPVDMIWHLGDYGAFGTRPAEVIRRVQTQIEEYGKDKVRAIGGNTDRYLVTGERFKVPPAQDEEHFNKLFRARTTVDAVLNWNLSQLSWSDYEWLAGILHKETMLPVAGFGPVIGYHAVPGDDEAFLTVETPEEEAADFLLDREGRLAIGGHIHVQMERTLGDWRVVNVGSVGMSSQMPDKAQWGLFTFDEDGTLTIDLRAVPYDTAAVIEELKTSGYPEPEWAIKRMGLSV